MMQDPLRIVTESDDEESALTPFAVTSSVAERSAATATANNDAAAASASSPSSSSHIFSMSGKSRKLRWMALSGLFAATVGTCWYATSKSKQVHTAASIPESYTEDVVEEVKDHRLLLEYETQQWEVRKHNTEFHQWLNDSLATSIEHTPLKKGQTHEQVMNRFLEAVSGKKEKDPKVIVPANVRDGIFCAMDMLQITSSLGAAVFYAWEAANSLHGARCPPEKGADVRLCAMTVDRILLFLGIMATFTESSIFECAHTINYPAMCAMEVTAATLTLVSWSNVGISMGVVCKFPNAQEKAQLAIKEKMQEKIAEKKAEKKEEIKQRFLNSTGLNSSVLASYLMEAHEKHKEYEHHKLEVEEGHWLQAECAMKIILGAAFIVRTFVEMLELGEMCESQTGCAMGIFAVIALWSKIAAVFSSVALYCVPHGLDNQQAACAATVTELMAGTNFAIPMVQAATVHCTRLQEPVVHIEDEE